MGNGAVAKEESKNGSHATVFLSELLLVCESLSIKIAEVEMIHFNSWMFSGIFKAKRNARYKRYKM